MKSLSLAATVLSAAALSPALAADLPSTKSPAAAPAVASPWDFDIGAGLTSDYIVRGITQTNHQPSVAAHGELRYALDPTWQLYAGVSAESIKLSPNTMWNGAPGGGTPPVEIDGDVGVRATFGAWSFDVGGIIYGYPDTPRTQAPRTDTWGEVYVKPSYAVTDALTLGAAINVSPSFFNTGADSQYLAANFKYNLPGQLSAFTLSGEIGRQWLGRMDSIFVTGGYYPQAQLPSYDAWNVGASYQFKFVTFDLRYYGDDLSPHRAFILTGLNNSGPTTSNFGRAAIVGTLSFDLTSKDLK